VEARTEEVVTVELTAGGAEAADGAEAAVTKIHQAKFMNSLSRFISSFQK